MKVEYISDPSLTKTDGDLIRLFDFTPQEAQAFRDIIRSQLLTNKTTFDISNVSFIQPINCSLKLRLGAIDRGIQRVGQYQFDCELTESSYCHMIDLLQPFVDGVSSRHQWLYDLSAEGTAIEFLFSPDGKW